MTIDNKKKLIRNRDIIDSQIDDEIVMMDIEKGAYFGLDSIGSIIWEMMEKPQTLDDVITQLTQQFDVTAKQCKSDIEPFIKQLVDANLLVEVG